MMEWLRSWFLGLVQGLTEFLPISSDGHLALFQILTQKEITQETGSEFIFFDVMLHLGTTAAILIYYRGAVVRGIRGLLGRADTPEYRRDALLRLMLLLIVATLPLAPMKFFFMERVEGLFQSLPAVGVGFLITAVVLVLTIFLPVGRKGPREMTWLDALVIGLAQALAPLPGVSRSGMTVAAALLRGLNKSWAVGFSLLIAVPAILAAAASELLDARFGEVSPMRWLQILSATLIAGVVGYFAINWLVRIVRSAKLWYFAVYLFLLAALILVVLAPYTASTRPPHARSHPVDGPLPRNLRPARGRLDGDATRASTSLALSERAGAAPGRSGLR